MKQLTKQVDAKCPECGNRMSQNFVVDPRLNFGASKDLAEDGSPFCVTEGCSLRRR